MAGATYRVIGEYVTLPSESAEVGRIVTGYYTGAIVPDGVPDNLIQHHLDRGLIKKVSASAAPKADDEGDKASAKSSSK